MHQIGNRVCILLAVACIIPAVVAAVPMTITIQGQLTDNAGVAVPDGNDWIEFRIFDAATAGSQLWSTGGYVEVVIENGLFEYVLGSNSPLPFMLADFDSLWLEMKRDGEPAMTPRVRLTSTMWSIRSAYADTASVAWGLVGDYDPFWYVDDQVLTTDSEWGLARGATGNISYGVKSSMINLGTACTTGTDGQGYFYGTISGGYGNVAARNYSTVGGGQFNKSISAFSTINGGTQNSTGADWASIGGGGQNEANGTFSSIAGGSQNYIGGSFGSVGGGYLNSAGGGTSTIGGGENNQAGGGHSTIGGGESNSAGGGHSYIGGGRMNRITDELGVIGGGSYDTCTSILGGISSGYANRAGDHPDDTAACVGGGAYNAALAKYSTIGGGVGNVAGGRANVVAGGRENTAGDNYASVLGGNQNTASGNLSTVGGGAFNAAAGTYASVFGGIHDSALAYATFVGGGTDNKAADAGCTVVGGQFNTARDSYATIGGGLWNYVDGYSSCIPGGFADTLIGNFSYLFGVRSKLTHDSTFMVDMPHIHFGDEDTGYEFPLNDGTGGQALVTDGAGMLNWADMPGSGAGGWIDDGASVRLADWADKVGIGLANPHRKFHLTDIQSAYARIEGQGIGASGLELMTASGGMANILKANDGRLSINAGSGSQFELSTESGGSFSFRMGSNYVLAIDDLGRTGIGVDGAINKLDVNGSAVIGDLYAGIRTAPEDGLLVQGKVGIGTFAPQTTLDVYGLARVQGDDWPTSGEGLELAYDPGLNRGFIQVYDRDASSWGQLALGNGKVGIGTANPQDPLEVKGFVRFDGGAGGGSALRIAEGGTLKWALLYRPWAAGKLGFYDEVNARWAIAMDPGNGRVGIGTDSPNYTLDVRGTIGNNTTLYHSDRRWKKNIATIDNALEMVGRLRGVRFEWRYNEYAEMQFSSGTRLGVIAQEVEDVVPELVHSGADGYKSVEYANLVAVLIEAVKELKVQSEKLETENRTLQERIEDLENKFAR